MPRGTLRADIASRYVCRLLNYMDAKGIARATPRAPAGRIGRGQCDEFTDLGLHSAGRERTATPGRSGPWRVTHAYEVDKTLLLDQPD